MKRVFWGFLFLFGAIVVSCTKNGVDTSGLYVPTTADTTLNATLLQLQQGRILYINNCGSCHGLHSPDEFSSAQWNLVIAQMGPRTNMSDTQIELVKKYVSRGKL